VGEAGFGFDPIFFVPEMRKTLAQLTSEEKNRISARGKLLMELRRYLALP
jgi:XTP/dITP diphosphohydrolase